MAEPGLTKLQAINHMLSTIECRPVSALDTGGASLAAQAERVLDEVDEEIQSEGWHENTEYDVELTPDGSDEIVLDSNVLSADSCSGDSWRDVCVRGGKLYDRDNNTHEFTDSILVTLIRKLDFVDLTPETKQFITAKATKIFQRRIRKNMRTDALLREELHEAQGKAKKANADKGDYNILNTPEARHIHGRSNVYHSRR